VACVTTLMLLSTGGEFCGRYASVTSVIAGVAPPAPRSSAFHWMYRAFGLVIWELLGFVKGSDQSLQVRSGLDELPDRVRNWRTHPVGTSPRQPRLPQRAAVPASCTGAS